jgi:hypothetical protein
MAELISKDIVDLQDIEKIQYLQTLQADPAQYAQFLADKQGRILSEVLDTKRASFIKVSGDMARMMDMDHNSQAALMRTMDLTNTQDQVIQQQMAQQAAVQQNVDTSRRQVEINDWYAENKRETLFVLQLVLLVVLAVTVTLAAQSTGWIGEEGANYLIFFFIMVGAGTWLYRWYYTAYIRDPRYWNRRTFAQDGTVAPPSGQICIGAGGETQPTDSTGVSSANGTSS